MAQTDHSKIVLLESDQSRRDYLKSLIAGWGYKPFIFENQSICLDNLLPLDPDLVISGAMATEKALHFIQSLKLIKQSLPVLIFTADPSVRTFADSNGFSDVQVIKTNVSPAAIKAAIYRILDPSANNGNHAAAPLVIGSSPAMLRVKSLIPKINQCRAAVLIQGEPGVGKELFARAIHSHSHRNGQHFTKINAVKLPYLLLEGELFGYPKSMCGIDIARGEDGVLAASDKGTFFIKEIGAMPVRLQAKLLPVVEDRAYTNSANQVHIPVDLRLIASTTRNLARLVKRGKFRKDLYYRLNVFSVTIPPLRERVEDIPSLVDFFCYKYCFEFGLSYFRLSDATKQALCRYHWPGNVKELADLIRQSVICGSQESVNRFLTARKAASAPRHPRRRRGDLEVTTGLVDLKTFLQKTNDYALKSVRKEFTLRTEKTLVGKALEAANWNRKKAAEILDISYKSLLNKMKQFGLG